MAVLAYARTSTADKQVLDSQLDALEKHGYDKLFTDQQSGKDLERPGYKAMMEYAREGDTIVAYSLSRITRSTKDAIAFAEEIEKRGINFTSLTEGIETETPAGKMFYVVLSALNQMQREQLVSATRQGLEAARARGRVGGRPRKDQAAVDQAMILYDSQMMSVKDIQKRTGVSPSTLYRHLRKRKEEKE